MAIEDVQGIVDSIHKAYARRLESQRLAQEQAHQETQEQLEQKRIDQAKEVNQHNYEHQKKEDAATAAMRALQYSQINQAIIGGYQEGKPLPPGYSAADQPLNPGKVFISAPDIDPSKPPRLSEALTPEAAQQQAQDRENKLRGPDSPLAIRERLFETQKEISRQDAATNAQMAAESRNNAAIESRDKIAAGQQAVQMAHIRALTANMAPRATPEALNAGVSKVHNGEMTEADAKIAFGKDFPILNNAVMSSGIGYYTKEQKALRGDVVPATNLLGQFAELQKVIKDNPYASKIIGTDAWFEARRLKKGIDEGLISSLKLLGQGSKLSDPRVRALTDAYGADQYTNPIFSNGIAMKHFKSLITEGIKGKAHGLSSTQLNDIYSDVGLLDNDTKASGKSAAPATSVAPEKQKALTDILGPAFAGVSPGGQQ